MLTCIVIDDEPLALDILTDYIGKVSFLQLVAATSDPIGALKMVEEKKIDLVFLDIQMPQLTGIQFMKIANGRAGIILTTAYSEYAMEGYEHNVIDYLLKPISFERFYIAAEKARKMLSVATPEIKPKEDYIFIKTDGRMVKVMLDDIILIQGLRDYITVQTTKEKLITLQSLRAMEEGLPADKFMRVHKSYIIAKDKVDVIERNRIFIGSEIIPIGETYQKRFFEMVSGKNLDR